ncbi:MAG: hypothetical protein AAF799_27670 [Myxococcota bacterium]
MTHGPTSLLASEASTNPGLVFPRTRAFTDELEPRSIAPMLMWARAYRLADERRAATVCLRRGFATTVATETPNAARTQAIEFAEDLASELIESGEVIAAAELVRLAAGWDEVSDPDRTVVTSMPGPSRRSSSARKPGEPPPIPSAVVFDCTPPEYSDEMDEVTLIFRRSDPFRAHSS